MWKRTSKCSGWVCARPQNNMMSDRKGNARSRRFPFPLPGYTLIEILIAIFIICVLAGASIALYRGVPSNKSPEKEAQKLANWLTNLATISNRTGRSFLLNCPGSVTRSYIEAKWLQNTKKDTYTSTYGCKFNRYGGQDVESRYSPQWSALAPTITIKVSRGQAEHYVIVSQHGRVRTNKRPASATGE